MNNKYIFIDWINHKLRSNRPYINFDFEISDEYLKNNSIELIDFQFSAEDVDNDEIDLQNVEFEEQRKNLANSNLYNIKKILDIVPKQENEIYNLYVKINEDYYENDNGEFLKEKLENVTRQGPNYFYGTCNFENLLDILYLKIHAEYGNYYEKNNEFAEKIVTSLILIEIPSENLYFYVYDERGGILVSGDSDKIKLKNIVSKLDSKLLNRYWFKDMIMKIFDYTEIEYKKVYDSVK